VLWRLMNEALSCRGGWTNLPRQAISGLVKSGPRVTQAYRGHGRHDGPYGSVIKGAIGTLDTRRTEAEIRY
jgi:hypothetical protein